MKSAKAADEAFQRGIASFGLSTDLVILERLLRGDQRIEVDRSLGWPSDRMLVLTMSRNDPPQVGPILEAAARGLRLILFDPEAGERHSIRSNPRDKLGIRH